jgi:hypothetical protein
MRETNKAYSFYLDNEDVTKYHPDIYDRLALDGRIDKDSCTPYIQKNYPHSLRKANSSRRLL